MQAYESEQFHVLHQVNPTSGCRFLDCDKVCIDILPPPDHKQERYSSVLYSLLKQALHVGDLSNLPLISAHQFALPDELFELRL